MHANARNAFYTHTTLGHFRFAVRCSGVMSLKLVSSETALPLETALSGVYGDAGEVGGLSGECGERVIWMWGDAERMEGC